jgi:hypothetical protein
VLAARDQNILGVLLFGVLAIWLVWSAMRNAFTCAEVYANDAGVGARFGSLTLIHIAWGEIADVRKLVHRSGRTTYIIRRSKARCIWWVPNLCGGVSFRSSSIHLHELKEFLNAKFVTCGTRLVQFGGGLPKGGGTHGVAIQQI